VRVDTPAFFAPTQSRASGSTTATDSNGSPAKVTLANNDSSDQTIDFGFVTSSSSCTAQLGDFVWNDLNGNGIQDAGEPGIAGVVLQLSGAATATTTTDDNGQYLFGGLCGGKYTVTVVPPPGGVPTKLRGTKDQTKDSNASPFAVNLKSGAVDMSIDFGFTFGGGNLCAYTIGYWKNHASAWPVDTLMLGASEYTQEELLQILNLPTTGDASLILARQLIAAKLNVAQGSRDAVATTISEADNLLATFLRLPLGTAVQTTSTIGQQMVALADTLDRYNNNAFSNGSCK